MKIVDKKIIFGEVLKESEAPLREIQKAIEATPIHLRPVVKGNGVKPIKDGVVQILKAAGWDDEYPMDLSMMRSKPLDAFKRFGELKAGLEWETGNISSSFRALMKLIKGLDEGQIDVGIHVLPSRAFYKYLTDRVGNITELLPYLDVFRKIKLAKEKLLVILVAEYDSLDEQAPLIPKGLDGNSLLRRERQLQKKKNHHRRGV